MNTLENTQKISLPFFVLFGLVHIVSGLMNVNGYYPTISSSVNSIMDIPFALAGLLYGATSLKLAIARPEKTHRILNAVLAIGILLIIGALVYINFFVPNLHGR
ncbi:hypothetical protein KKG51_03550 [Patescibacteria group bacterium]|nr:hypothetical protein [Patescibacteria group bacterium]